VADRGQPAHLVGTSQAAAALLLTGPPGAGKTTVLTEVLGLLERRGVACAGIDLDWLCWVDLPGDPGLVDRMLVANLTDVADRYLRAGVRRLVLARAVEDAEQARALRDALGSQLHVVGLAVDLAVLEQRLGAAPARPVDDRLADLELARHLVAAQPAVGEEGPAWVDHWVAATASPRQVAEAVLRAVGW
jgi:energy-coupling factor transporter ATP-binding protein EcfA2